MKSLQGILLLLIFLILSCSPPGERERTDPDWIVYWGNENTADYAIMHADDVALTADEKILVCGNFSGIVYFDPDYPGTRTAKKMGYKLYLSCFNTDGQLEWNKTWGQPDYNQGGVGGIHPQMVVDTSNNIFINQYWHGETDFDPGPDQLIKDTDQMGSYAVIELTPDGELKNFLTWESEEYYNQYLHLAADGGFYLLGGFDEGDDLDPTDGVLNLTLVGDQSNAFLCKYNEDGKPEWTKQWFGIYIWNYSEDPDGNVVITGSIERSADLDPGPGEDIHDAYGEWVTVLIKLNPDGEYLWGISWNDHFETRPYDIDIDAEGNIYITGVTLDKKDRSLPEDADWEVQNRNNTWQTFLVKISPSGEKEFDILIGGDGEVSPVKLSVANEKIALCGDARGLTDFDPSNDSYWLRPDGIEAEYIVVLDDSGKFIWATLLENEWREEDKYVYERFYDIELTDDANIYVTGGFGDLAFLAQYTIPKE